MASIVEIIMSLEFWSILWKGTFIVGVVLFAALASVVAVGGARDIVRLLRTLREHRPDDDYEATE